LIKLSILRPSCRPGHGLKRPALSQTSETCRRPGSYELVQDFFVYIFKSCNVNNEFIERTGTRV